jgi:hypothetical protein
VSSRHRHLTVLGVILAAALMCAVALAGTIQTYSQKFTVKHPGQATGMTLRTSARATGGATPKQPKTVTLTFPSGMKLDPFSIGATAKIGSGTATFIGTPARTVTVYNRRPTGMTLVISNPVGMSVTMNGQYAHMGGQLVLTIPKFRIPPAVLSGLSLSIKAGSTKQPFMRTPTKCPAGGWKFSAAFVYPAGTPREVLSSTSACVKH